MICILDFTMAVNGLKMMPLLVLVGITRGTTHAVMSYTTCTHTQHLQKIPQHGSIIDSEKNISKVFFHF